jgi:hypothetical protein
VHDGAPDGRGEHSRRHARVRPERVAHEHRVQAVEYLVEVLVAGEGPDEHRVSGQRALHAAALDRQGHDAGEQGLARQFCAGLGRGRVEHRLQPRYLSLGGGDDDLFLGLELMVDGGLRHADRVSDHLQGRPADAVLSEQPGGGADDARLRGAGQLGQRAARGCGCCFDHSTRVTEGEPSDFAWLMSSSGTTWPQET